MSFVGTLMLLLAVVLLLIARLPDMLVQQRMRRSLGVVVRLSANNQYY